MKHIFLLLSLYLVIGCKTKVIETPTNAIQDVDTTEEVSDESANIPFLHDELQELVSHLASDDLEGRRTGTKGIEKAAEYIETKLKDYKVKPYFDSYRDNYKVGDKNAFNVVGFIEGNDPVLKKEIIILGAHYDHIGQGQSIKKYGGKLTEIDSIANGANDDASGTAAVMAMAKYFADKKSNKRSIIFALYSGEEFGLLGSKHLAERLKNENLNLYTMISFEMIGVPFRDRDYTAFVTGYELSNMASKFNEYAGFKLLGLSDVAKKYSLFQRSDNYPFYEAFKLPCQSISSCDLTNYDFYHHVDDESNQLDYNFMTAFLNHLIPVIEKMSITPTKEIKMYE